MRRELMDRLEMARYNLEHEFDSDNIDVGAQTHVYADMVRAYMKGIGISERPLQDVDLLAFDMLRALAASSLEQKPTEDFALTAAKAAVARLAFYLPEPKEASEVFKDMTDPRSDVPMQGEGIEPIPTPFMEAMGSRLGGDLGVISPRTPEPPEGQPYAPRSGAQLFGELMLEKNGRYEMLEGVKFPPDWSKQECENYIRYKRELEARHIASRQRPR